MKKLVKPVKPFGRGAPAAVSGEPARRFGQVDYVVFDTETTGLRPAAGDEVVQIAGIRISGGNIEPAQNFNEMVNPGRAIPALSTEFHRITDAMVVNMPSAGAVFHRFHHWCGCVVLVAHNAAFDLKFLELKQGASGVRFDHSIVDTLLLSAALDKYEADHSLEAIAERFAIDPVGRHTALGDATMTAAIFLRLLAMARGIGAETIADLLAISKRAKALLRMQRRNWPSGR